MIILIDINTMLNNQVGKIKYEDFLMSSNGQLGAINKNALGSQFSINFDSPYTYDAKAKSITMEVLEVECFFNQPNVSVAINNYRIEVTGQNNLNVLITAIISIPDGLYDPSTLNSALQTQLLNAGIKADQIVFTGNQATNKIDITLNSAGAEINFNNVDYHGMADLLGFPYQIFTAVLAGEVFSSTLDPTFNKLQYFLITSNITSNGTTFNGKSSSIISRVLITGSANFQLINEPQHPYSHDLSHMKGRTIRSLTFELRDDLLQLVETRGESWSLRYRLVYEF
jgi:hypothetical protein